MNKFLVWQFLTQVSVSPPTITHNCYSILYFFLNYKKECISITPFNNFNKPVGLISPFYSSKNPNLIPNSPSIIFFVAQHTFVNFYNSIISTNLNKFFFNFIIKKSFFLNSLYHFCTVFNPTPYVRAVVSALTLLAKL
jgi:hypothetical protein